MHKSKIFLYFCSCFILGIALRSFWSLKLFYGFIFLLLCLIFVAVFWSNFKVRFILLGAAFLFLGIFRYEMSLPKINAEHIAFYNGQEIEFIGQIVSEPDMGEKYVKLTVGSHSVGSMLLHGATMKTYLQSGSKQGLGANLGDKQVYGKVLVNVYKYGENDFNYGDWVQIKCHLEAPGVMKSEDKGRDFDYGRYLSVKDIYSVCYWPSSIATILNNRGTTRNYAEELYADILKAKQKFKNVIDENVPLPESGLLAAMLLGYRREITSEMNDQFAATGVSHIIAISGLNITLIAGLIFYSFMALGLNRGRAFWPTVFLLLIYVVMIGFQASAVRALIMGIILLYALKIGRLNNGLNPLLLAAVLLLLINPKLLIFDIGFQLSFLAVLGMLYFYPLFSKWLKFMPEKWQLRSMICLTLSAQVLTTPLIVYYFGRLSFISPLTNLLILPVLPVMTAGGFLLIFFGLIWTKLAFVAGIFLWLILGYIIKVVEILSQVPSAYYHFF